MIYNCNMSVKHLNIGFLVLISMFLMFFSSCGVVKRTAPEMSETSGQVIASGIASWYGPNFHGKLTANGEKYNMNSYTAAHKTLPFNTVVRVDNVENGKSVTVRINDRGPYVTNRIIDLSRRAAEDLDMIGNGTASVRLMLIREGDRPVNVQNTSSEESFTIQLAAFEIETDAIAQSKKINGSRVETVVIGEKTIYRIYFGTYSNPVEAKKDLDKLTRQGYEGFVKQIEN